MTGSAKKQNRAQKDSKLRPLSLGILAAAGGETDAEDSCGTLSKSSQYSDIFSFLFVCFVFRGHKLRAPSALETWSQAAQADFQLIIAKDNLELLTLQPPHPKWDGRQVPPHSL
jgi:hypothetical protein